MNPDLVPSSHPSCVQQRHSPTRRRRIDSNHGYTSSHYPPITGYTKCRPAIKPDPTPPEHEQSKERGCRGRCRESGPIVPPFEVSRPRPDEFHRDEGAGAPEEVNGPASREIEHAHRLEPAVLGPHPVRHEAINYDRVGGVGAVDEEAHPHGHRAADDRGGRARKAELKDILAVQQTRLLVGVAFVGHKVAHAHEGVRRLAVA
mmetsp:Transcript_23554/g.40200  ORF Transcript_23554/g.40200 Transcript_23554/m.40200 type:complete len:203 (-) Transcript_23554:139-747(-)